MKSFENGLLAFSEHYAERYKEKVNAVSNDLGLGTKFRITVEATPLKKNNFPCILHHGNRTKDVVVLTHGLSDSPYYVEAIARRFFNLGCNVVMPLLPAHGLIDPNLAMEDTELDSKWKITIDNAVYTALNIGDRVTIGGFSTGGALSLNKVLRNPEEIDGGLLLFSAALDLGSIKEGLSKFSFVQAITKLVDGQVVGIGRDPYKYPKLPIFAGAELGQIIEENEALMVDKKIKQKVFAAHSVHDATVKIEGIIHFLEYHVERGMALLLSENVSHSELVLDRNIQLDTTQTIGPKYPPRANPKFGWMMDNVVRFFKEEIT